MSDWRVTGFVEREVLGIGAQGRVVLARHEASDQEAAIKYLFAGQRVAVGPVPGGHIRT